MSAQSSQVPDRNVSVNWQQYGQPPGLHWIAVLTLLFFGVPMLPGVTLFEVQTQYLPLHHVLELLPMIVSGMVFALAWNLREQADNNYRMLLGAGFLAVCLIDTAHTLSYPGMPDLVTPSSADKALQFWLAARYVATAALLAVAVIPVRTYPQAASYGLVTAAIGIASGVWWMVLFHGDVLPRTFVEGQGLTAFKIEAEYVIALLDLLSAVLIFRKARRSNNVELYWLAAACWVQALAELTFTFYTTLTDLTNMLGHLYKVIAYLMVYRALFVGGVQAPYRAANLERAQLQAVIGAIPDLLFEMDRRGVYYEIWSASESTLARQKEQLLGRRVSVSDVFPPEAADTILAALAEADRKGTSAGTVVRLEIGDQPRWFELSVSKRAGGAAHQARFILLSRDITERKEHLNSLVASEEFYQAIADNGQALIWVSDANQRLEYFNRPWLEFTGRSLEQELINGIAASVHPDDYQRSLAIQAKAFERREKFSVVSRLHRHDGEYRWMISEGTPRYDHKGNFIGYVGHCLDVTEIKTAQEELGRHRLQLEQLVGERTLELEGANAQLNALFELSPDGFAAFAYDGRVKFVNPSFEALTGISSRDAVEMTEAQLDEELRRRCENPLTFKGLAAYTLESPERSSAGTVTLVTPRHRVLQLLCVRSDSLAVSRILYLHDITHEAEVDRLKSEFLSHAAHELRTPMASVFGFSELLLEVDLDEATRRDLLQTIHRQTSLLVQIINELLDLARIEARRGKDFTLEDVNLATLVRDTVADLAFDSARWPTSLSLPAGPAMVRADAAKARQVVVNVLSNGQKYSPDGGEIAIRFLGTRAGFVGLEVTDHGIGMTAQQVGRVGERFWRADTSGKTPGTGLGMAIVKEIIELHGGQMEVHSRPQVGTTITLWFPETTPSSD